MAEEVDYEALPSNAGLAVSRVVFPHERTFADADCATRSICLLVPW
jgi:hypothetical protein